MGMSHGTQRSTKPLTREQKLAKTAATQSPEALKALLAAGDAAAFKPGGKITLEQAKTVPLWMAEDALADEDGDGEYGAKERARIRIDIENIKTFQGVS